MCDIYNCLWIVVSTVQQSQLIYQLIERHSSNNLLPRFLGPKAVRQTFEIADTAFCNKVGISLNTFEIAFRIPLGENSGILLYQGDFNSAESFIYPAIGKDFVVGWWHKNQWIPLLAMEKQHQKAYDNADLEELLRSGFRRIPIDISEVICHYIYSEIEEENAKDNDIVESFEVNDPNENYTSVGIYYFEEGQLKELTECEIA
ncbi:MAG: hypothetical protein IPP17_10685 [Bacteroidetes bacterium]|nr:hypothetical protein [Bacteroidota bacterium]